MFVSDTLSGFFDSFSPSTFFSPIGSLDSLFSGAENVWKGFTGQSSNEAINSENVAFQRENLDYQKALQQQIFDREDTSYQRTVQDMRSAGLSPLMMKSTNNAGAAIQTQAPQKQFESVNSIPLITQALTELNSLSVGQAQRDNINAQTRALELENEFNEWNLGYKKNMSVYDDYSAHINARKLGRQFEFDKFTGQSLNTFMNSINQARITSGKKPFDSDTWLHRDEIKNNTETDMKIDFNELVNYSRYALTMDMVDKVGDLIPKGSLLNLGGKKK